MPENVFFTGSVLWSQVDMNRHMRHSSYADFCAQARLVLLDKLGLTTQVFQKLKIGPILLREELCYLKEVGLNDTLQVTCAMLASKKDGSRWSFRQEIYRGDGKKAAIITVDGAWLDLQKRKITALPDDVLQKFEAIPKTEDYKILDL